ncbi:MAG: hypothetical protein LH606_13050 [Cytophagaceae bacterium]|nr:hypothetical protein [Cytophagaceae bacterium]
MLKSLRWPLLWLGLCGLPTPAPAQLAGRGKLLRTPETPFVPQNPSQKNYIGWEKFKPFTLAPGERLWWENFATGNDLTVMLERGVTHQSVVKTPQAYMQSLPAEKRALILGANLLEGTYFVDGMHRQLNGLMDPFMDSPQTLRDRMGSITGGQTQYLGQVANVDKTPIQLVYLDFENRAQYYDDQYARNLLADGRFAVRGEKGHYSDDQYLNEYRSKHPGDTRDNATLLSKAVRNTVDAGIYCVGGPQGHLSKDAFYNAYTNAWGEQMCVMIKHLQTNMMPGVKIASIDVSPGEPDIYLSYEDANLSEKTEPYRWPWPYDCSGGGKGSSIYNFSDASYYPRVNPWRNGQYYNYGHPEHDNVVNANITDDRMFLSSYLSYFENSVKIKGDADFVTLWYPFHDGAQGPESTHFDYPIRNDAAEAMAIFGLLYGTTFQVWSPHGYKSQVSTTSGPSFRACEWFIAGLRRMAWHNDLRTGNFQRITPEISLDGGQTWHRDNLYQSKNTNRPIVRAIVKGNEILVLGFNSTANDASDMTVMVRHNSWQDTIVLKGRNAPDRRTYVGRAIMN